MERLDYILQLQNNKNQKLLKRCEEDILINENFIKKVRSDTLMALSSQVYFGSNELINMNISNDQMMLNAIHIKQDEVNYLKTEIKRNIAKQSTIKHKILCRQNIQSDKIKIS